MIVALLLAFALAYLLGSIPFGLIVAGSQGVDIRKEGSGNIGATNVWRVMGRKWGLITFFCDFAKGLFAVLIARWLAQHFTVLEEVTQYTAAGATKAVIPVVLDPNLTGIAAAVGCIVGHNFPIWLKFKGGKGVATSLGVICGMMPLASLGVFLVWWLTLKLTRYVSLASIVGALSLPIIVIVFLFMGWMRGWSSFYFAIAATLMVILRHIGNIRRLIAGTENRFGTPKPEDSPEEPEA